MKKIICLIISVIILSFCLVTTAFAIDEKNVTFNDDFTVMDIDGKKYSRARTKELIYYGREHPEQTHEFNINFTDKQKDEIESIDVYSDTEMVIIDVDINYFDGAVLQVSFLYNKYINDYDKLYNGKADKYEVEFYAPPEINPILTYDALLENAPVKNDIYTSIMDSSGEFSVFASTSDDVLYMQIGTISSINDKWYFCSNKDNNFNETSEWVYNDEIKQVYLREITDEDAIKQLNNANEYFLKDSMGFIYDDDLTQTVTIVFAIIILGIIPFGLLISSFVLMVKTKNKTFKKIFGVIAVLCLVELIVFSIIIYLVTSDRFLSDVAMKIQEHYIEQGYY